jgi:lysine-specific histone demethylase 1
VPVPLFAADDIIIINREPTVEAVTMLTIGFLADSLIDEEIEAGVVSDIGGIEQVNYILIRNHLLTRWGKNFNSWLAKEPFTSLVPPHCDHLLTSTYNFLISHGHVNFGVAPAIKDRIPMMPPSPTPSSSSALASPGSPRHGTCWRPGSRWSYWRWCGGRVYTKKMEGDGCSAATDLGGSVLTGTSGNPLRRIVMLLLALLLTGAATFSNARACYRMVL